MVDRRLRLRSLPRRLLALRSRRLQLLRLVVEVVVARWLSGVSVVGVVILGVLTAL